MSVESVADPQKYYLNNISNSLAMLQVMLEFDVKMMIFSSSAATFGEPEVVPIPEDHPKNPTNPYGRSKLMLEHILKEYEHAYGLRSIWLRYFNASGADPSGLIGEDHTPEHHLMPLVLQVALGQRDKSACSGPIGRRRTAPACGTTFTSAISRKRICWSLDALRNGNATTAYNMGNGSGYSVMEVVNDGGEGYRQVD